MAFGQDTKIVAFPQSGTSNQPFPVGNLPAYVPVVTTITDTHTAAILDQTERLIANFNSEHFKLQAKIAIDLAATLNQLNINLAKLSDVYEAQSKAISDLEATYSVKVMTEVEKQSLTTTSSTNQIKFNNYGRAINKENPKMPSIKEQFEETLVDSINLNTISSVNNLAVSSINSITNTATELITNTETFKGLSSWISNLKNTIMSAIVPPSPGVIASNAASIAGQKIIPGD
jgi:dGTP triphosphohydrolase